MIGVAIIGTGDIADYHIEAYLRFSDRCEIRAVADIFPEKARQKAEKFGLRCDNVADYRDLLRRSDIQLVSICLPPSMHAEVSIDFLLAGKHVLCEKPMAPTLEECDRMLAAARESGSKLSIVAQTRFKTDVMRTKKMLETGSLGKPLFAQANSLWWRGSNYYDLWRRGTWEKEGGGCTFIHAVHHIDLLLWLMGPVKEIRALAANRTHDNSEVEDLSIVTVQFDTGALGSLVSSLFHHGEEQSLSIDAKNASIGIPHKIAVSRQLDNGYPEPDEDRRQKLEAEYSSLPEVQFSGHSGQIDDTLSAIEGDRTPLIDGTDGRRAIEFIMGVYQSAFTGSPVTLPMTEKDEFYTKEGLMRRVVKFYKKSATVTNYKDIGISVGGSL